MIKVNLENAIDKKRFLKYEKKVSDIHKLIHNKTGLGKEFLGWVDLLDNYNSAELNKMKKVAKQLKNKIDYLVVIGIGGSYLGSRAAIEMINGLYSTTKIKIVYAGHTMSSTYTKQVLEFLKTKKFGICVISKSGTTTEPAIAFRLFKQLLIKQVGTQKLKDFIVCITDQHKGALKELADQNKYETFVIPDDIGGRYSVLTPVGIFVMLVADINVDNVLIGAKQATKDLKNINNNSAYQYALARFILNKEEKYLVELLVSYEIQMQYYTEWWKQLFGESEGKNGKGLFPASCIFSTDLHSLGQFIQEGNKCLFETIIKFNSIKNDVKMIHDNNNLDNLNYLEKRTLNEINYIAQEGVLRAHKDNGKVPNIILEFDSMDDKMFGYSVYWFFIACAMSAYLLEINPFNQPGVEIYKSNMFKLLGKK